MNIDKVLEELKDLGPEATSIAVTMEEVLHNNKEGKITKDEAEYLLNELKDAKIAYGLANDEIATRLAVQACNFIMSVLL